FTPLPAFMSQASSSGGLEIPEYLIFWIYLSYYAVSVIGYTFAGNLIDKQGNRKILFIGVTIRIVIYLVFAIFSIFTAIAAGTPFGYITIILLLIFSGISYSLMNVALQNTLPRLITKNIGEVLALYSIIAGISSIVGSFFSGLIVENPGLGYLWLFIFSVIFAGIAFAIYFKAVKKGS
ncbi:MAG: MFS transporter, partial [Promethearchaeota archaeon]